jgi:hypothetical protein
MAVLSQTIAASAVSSLSHGERVGVRGYGPSIEPRPLTRAFGATFPHRGEVNRIRGQRCRLTAARH